MKYWTLAIACIFCSGLEGQIANASFGDWEFSNDNKESWIDSFPEEKGVYWLRAPLQINTDIPEGKIIGLGVSMLASTEVYWDGELIGKNGVVGKSKKEEVPGLMNEIFYLTPDQTARGQHVVEIKYSNFYGSKQMRFYGIVVMDFIDAIEKPLILTAFIHIYAGFFLIIGLFYLIRFVLDKSTLTSLLFSLLCFGFFALIMVEYMKFYTHYIYPWHFVRLKLILGITIFIGLCMITFFLSRFNLLKMWWSIAIPATMMVGLSLFTELGYDFSTNLTMIIGFISASVICLYAAFKSKSNAFLLLLSVLPAAIGLIFWFRYYDLVLYIGFGNLVLVNLISLALSERKIRREKEAAIVMSTRLKLDLLKKNIQPHFINNSITSAIDWIERSPEKGVEFLFALSKEFDILLEISEKKRIPIIKEVELCRAHLDIMSFRKEEPYALVVENIDEYDIIPPAIFLTVIENGISHQNSEGKGVVFTLRTIYKEREKTYIIHVNGQSVTNGGEVLPGTGTKYIEARLEESYPSAWKLRSFQVSDGWQTEISILT